jgi:putative oxidoreductase
MDATNATKRAGAVNDLPRWAVWAHQPDVALLLVRVMVGIVGVFHGAQKLFGWFEGSGIAGFAGGLENMGIPLPTLSAYLAGGAEFFGGLLLIVGLVTRVAALPFAFTMFVAVTQVHNSAFDARANGMEYPLTLLVVLVAIALAGAGRFSVDAVLWCRGRTDGSGAAR